MTEKGFDREGSERNVLVQIAACSSACRLFE